VRTPKQIPRGKPEQPLRALVIGVRGLRGLWACSMQVAGRSQLQPRPRLTAKRRWAMGPPPGKREASSKQLRGAWGWGPVTPPAFCAT
jgi:hypothetical protein